MNAKRNRQRQSTEEVACCGHTASDMHFNDLQIHATMTIEIVIVIVIEYQCNDKLFTTAWHGVAMYFHVGSVC